MRREDQSMDLLHQIRHCGHYLHHVLGGGRASQSRTLHILEEHGEVTQRQLLELMNIRQSSLSEVVQKLEEQGLIQRERSDADRRQIIIRLSDTGKKQIQHMDEQRILQSRDLLAALTDEEQQQLSRLLGKLLEAWTPPREEGHHHGRRGRAHK